MNVQRILLALLSLAVLSAADARPALEFQSDGVRVRGIAAGNRVAWSGMLREQVGYHESTRVVRGIGTVGANGELSIAAPGADPARSVWLFTNLDAEGADRSFRIGTDGELDPAEIGVTVTAGQDHFSVEAAAVALIYIPANGDPLYFFAADGSDLDADEQNGTIVVRLSKLKSWDDPANSNPPPVTKAGDAIQIFDVYEWRSRDVEVAP